jgi:polysaccharide biosynthesis protein PslG
MHPSSPRLLVKRTALPLASVLVAALAVVGQHQAASASLSWNTKAPRVHTVTVDPKLFGVHDAHLKALSRAGTGSIRLWDTGTTWAQMQPTSGAPDFSRLDQIVRDAHANGTEVTMVVAMTPAWAAPDPSNPAYQTEMPDLAAYKGFLTTLMGRYKDFQFGPGDSGRGIANYQVWNEANIINFWSGTAAQMAQLTAAAAQVRSQVDPGARLLAPALVSRLPFEQKWIRQFYAQKVNGRPVWKYVDALTFNLYPLETYPTASGTRPGTPEDSIRLLNLTRLLLYMDGLPSTVPIWNTEINYGMRSGGTGAAVPIPDDLQIAYVMRTFLLNAAQGVKRVNWYAYDMGNLPAGGTLGNTLLTDPNQRSTEPLTPAGQAFGRIQGWLDGALVGTTSTAPCAHDIHGTYTCLIRYPDGSVGRVYWNAYGSRLVTLSSTAQTIEDEHGTKTAVTAGQKTLQVDYKPVLVRSTS